MGLGLSKVWKGIKKHVKKVARGVKKVFQKIGKAVGKLGIVGQLGMMFLMPYAFGALSSFAGQAWNALGQFAQGSTGFLSTPLRAAAKMIHTAGTQIGKVYTNISETIGGAIDKTKEVLGIKPNADLITGVDESLKVGESSLVDASKVVDVTTQDGLKESLRQSVESSLDIVDVKPKGLLERITDIPGRIKEDISSFDVYEYGKQLATGTVESSLVGGAKMALQQKTAEALGWEQPEGADFYTVNMDTINSLSKAQPSVFDTVDFLASTQGGNPFYGTSIANSQYVSDILNPQIDAYTSYMNAFNKRLGG
jgi:hypothetical protein